MNERQGTELRQYGHLLRPYLEELRYAGNHLLFNTIGGSSFVPASIRRRIYAAAGASLESPPGTSFTFAGSPRNLTLKRHVYINQRVFIEANAPVTLGEGCAVGMEAIILTSHHAVDQLGRWSPNADGRAVAIGDRVWIGARALILPGAMIDSDVIIAAGAVVSGHLRSHGLYAGVPARRIRDYLQIPREGQ